MGYIKMFRQLVNWRWFRNPPTLVVFIYCLLMANWQDGEFENVDIPRGSFASSINRISLDTGLSVRNVRTALKHLKSTNELTIATSSKYTIITVNNYDKYQVDDRHEDKNMSNKCQSTDRSTEFQETTIEEYKENKKINNNKSTSRFIVPTVEEVSAYVTEKGMTIDPQKFHDYYSSNGWIVGKSKMKDWKAACRTWQSNDSKRKPKTTYKDRKFEYTEQPATQENLEESKLLAELYANRVKNRG